MGALKKGGGRLISRHRGSIGTGSNFGRIYFTQTKTVVNVEPWEAFILWQTHQSKTICVVTWLITLVPVQMYDLHRLVGSTKYTVFAEIFCTCAATSKIEIEKM